MDSIDKNSFEAINLFVIYICFQDGVVSKEEASEIVLESSILKHYYFECYGEICDLDMEEISLEMQEHLISKFKFFDKNPSKKEISYFDNLISDMRLRDIALMSSKLAASKDGLDQAEEDKWNYWFNRWIK
tara:strand:- start:864 stop:1256 length:393 start_codon:yes stop_codon:yes gene_type:complete